MFTTISTYTFMLLPGRQPAEYHLCTGTNPKLDSIEIKYPLTLYFIYVISILLHVSVPIKIALYRQKNCVSFESSESLQADNNQYMMDCTTSFAVILLGPLLQN